MTTTQFLPFGKTRAQRFLATVAAVAATASLVAAFQVSSARAAVEPAQALLLPAAYAVASAEADQRGDGSRGRVRERGPDQGPQQAEQDQRFTIDKHLTNDQVRDIVAGNLAQRGNANLKTGKVTAKEDGVVTVEIVTKTGALVDTRDISTKTGRPAGHEGRFGQLRHGMAAHRGGHPGEARFARGSGERSPGAKGPGEKRHDLALTTDQAKKLAEARLIIQGNPHLKVGAVKEKDADTISIDIVASDNSLVSQQLLDRHSGRPQRPFGERRS